MVKIKLSTTLFLLKILIVIILLIIFLNYFAKTSLKKYLAEETMFVESFRDVELSDFPVISVAREYPHVDEECYNETNVPDNITKCLLDNTKEFQDMIVDVVEDGDNQSLIGQWETSFTDPYWGRIYFSKDPHQYHNDRYLMIKLVDYGHPYTIDLHDQKFYIERSEQMMDFQRINVLLYSCEKVTISMSIEQIVLLPEVSSCNNEKDYSLMKCTKVRYLK